MLANRPVIVTQSDLLTSPLQFWGSPYSRGLRRASTNARNGVMLVARPQHLELAGTGARAPVKGAPRKMCDGENNDAVRLRAIDQGEAKPLDDDAAGIGARRRTGKGKREGTRCGVFHCRGEALAQAGLRFIVVDDFG